MQINNLKPLSTHLFKLLSKPNNKLLLNKKTNHYHFGFFAAILNSLSLCLPMDGFNDAAIEF